MAQRDFPPTAFSGCTLLWREVRVPLENGTRVTRTRLLLVDPMTGEAMDAGLGEVMRCRLLEKYMDRGTIAYRPTRGSDFIEIRVIRRRLGTDSTQSLVLEGPIYQSGPDPIDIQQWTQMDCNDMNNAYFASGTIRVKASRLDDISVNGPDEGTPKSVLDVDGRPFAFELENKDVVDRSGRLLQTALLGEVRMAFRMGPPAPDGIYDLNLGDDRRLAIKVIKHPLGRRPASSAELTGVQEYARENPMVEIDAMGFLANTPNMEGSRGHPNIISFLGVCTDECNVYLLLPFIAGGDMFSHIGRCPANRYNEAAIRVFMRQILSGIHFMHSVGVCHNDISTENFLMHVYTDGSVERIVIIDLGQARLHYMDPFRPLPPRGLCDAPGKHVYYCPDTYIFAPAPYSGLKIDVWQLGILVLIMATGSSPFRYRKGRRKGAAGNDSILSWFEHVHYGRLDDTRVLAENGTTVTLSEAVSPELLHAIHRMLAVDPAARASLEELAAMFL